MYNNHIKNKTLTDVSVFLFLKNLADTIRIILVTTGFFLFLPPFVIVESEKQKKGYEKMKKQKNNFLFTGAGYLMAFIIWTILIQTIDVQPIGPNGTAVGLASLNRWFHNLTGMHLAIYHITDWLGLVPVFVCIFFGILGLIQLFQRKNLLRVDHDILFLGIYYILVISAYLIFEMFPLNYRPILIEGRLEASYPSSTTLLVLSVMPTLIFQAERRLKNTCLCRIIRILTILFSCFMVIGRLISGVHWFTDILGSAMLSTGLFHFYKSIVISLDKKEP